jgi:NhaP-type Na+/H+ or K+/H+ antiporter
MTSAILLLRKLSALFIFREGVIMLLSFALIVVCGLALGGIMQKLKLPPLLGMLIVGIVLGPYALNLIAPEILVISADLRQIALVIILLRAGLALDIKALKKVGRPAVLMCFVPALVEIAATVVFAPLLFGISYWEAAIMGAVLGAVSPAVIVPRMLKLIENKRGLDKNIPQIIMAGASADDVFCIVLFTSFMSTYETGSFDFLSLAKIPASILTGLALGVLVGFAFVFLFKKLKMRATVKALLILAAAVLFVVLENTIKPFFPLSGLLGVMALGCVLLKFQSETATELSAKFNKIWLFAEILLFVLVAATVDLKFAVSSGGLALVLVFIVLAFRFGGVWLCFIKTPLNMKERLFCAMSYLPKATVQAAIGALPLAAGVPAGSLILTIAVLSILVTAPLGAFGIDLSYKRLLSAPLPHEKSDPV